MDTIIGQIILSIAIILLVFIMTTMFTSMGMDNNAQNMKHSTPYYDACKQMRILKEKNNKKHYNNISQYIKNKIC